MSKEEKPSPVFQGRGFDQVRAGEKFCDWITVTETHLVLSCALFKDFNPLHAVEPLARESPFQRRIFPGPLTAGVMTGVLGNYFAGTIQALVELRVRFRQPVRAGDTLNTVWTVRKKKKTHTWGGVILLEGACTNQEGATVAHGEAKILVANEIGGGVERLG